MKHQEKTPKKAKRRAARAKKRRPSKEEIRALHGVALAFAGTMLFTELMKIGREVRAKRKQRKKGADVNGRHRRLGPNEPKWSVH